MIKFAITAATLITCAPIFAQERPHDKVFFDNAAMPGSYFYSKTSAKSPATLKSVRGQLPVSDRVFFTPPNSLRLEYSSPVNGKWQAAIINKPLRGMDFFAAPTHLQMKLFVDANTLPADLPMIGIAWSDTTPPTIRIPLEKFSGPLTGNQWNNILIPLDSLPGIKAGGIASAYAIVFSQPRKPTGHHLLYIDQVELIRQENSSITTTPRLTAAKGYEKHVSLSWEPVDDTAVKYVKVYRSQDETNFYPVGIQSPNISLYADYTDTVGKKFYYRITLVGHNYDESPMSNTESASTAPMTDDQLLDMVQEANFRYYWNGAEPASGLSLENIQGRPNMIATGASGFGIMALIVGADRKFITRDQLVERFEKITSFLLKADRFHGAFPHFLDGPSGKTVPFFGTEDNGADLVETSFLMQGLLAAKQYFTDAVPREKSIREKIDKLWREVEWDWFRKEPDSKYLLWHWSPDQEWVINHKLIGWNETMITYVLGICSPTHAVPASLYYSGWASQEPEAQTYRKNWGKTADGSRYTNGKTYFGVPLKVGVSTGGPIFFVHYSFLGLDPHKMTDAYTNYFINNTSIATINYKYCIANPLHRKGYSAQAWGLTASDGPWDYSADEPATHSDHGKITPTGALASFPYLPKQAMAAMKNYYRNYGKFAWGEYGFRDAFDLDKNWCSEIFMGLNQAPITIMIENYRSGLIWKLFMSNPEIAAGVNKIKVTAPK